MVRGENVTEEQRKACRAFVKWLRVRAKWDKSYDAGWLNSLDIDVDHSALLGRLLSGGEPFDFPPPLAYSYPWYSLLEEGCCHGIEVHLNPLGLRDHVGIAQMMWKIVDQTDNRTYIIEYREDCPKYKLFHEDESIPNGWSLRIIK